MNSKEEIHQIQFQKLLFTQNWEDPALDKQALAIKSGDKILTITSGGCNTLGFLIDDPETIYAIDINGSQNWLNFGTQTGCSVRLILSKLQKRTVQTDCQNSHLKS